MKLYTKTGDDGSTGLFGGKRLPKDHIRIEAYGTVDELNAQIGLLRENLQDAEDLCTQLMQIQNQLFEIGSNLATDPAKEMEATALKTVEIGFLEKKIDIFSAELPELKNFILPGGNVEAALAHVCRTVCRRAERRVIALGQSEEVDERIVPYINRLSDYFFILSRFLVFRKDDKEIIWRNSDK